MLWFMLSFQYSGPPFSEQESTDAYFRYYTISYTISYTDIVKVPSLYVCPVENVLGQMPLIQCNLNGNSANTIPHCLRGKIQKEAAANSKPDGGTGSRLFEINLWMWRYVRTFPPQFTVEQGWASCGNAQKEQAGIHSTRGWDSAA